MAAADASDDFAEVPESEKTPVTVITGFLGAGKSTLVNYILTNKEGWRIAIIENEFGEVNIDEDLVKEQIKSKEDIVSMDNGCVCCTVRGDLVLTLNSLVPRRKVRSGASLQLSCGHSTGRNMTHIHSFFVLACRTSTPFF